MKIEMDPSGLSNRSFHDPVFEPEASAFRVANAINPLDLWYARAALYH